MTKVYTLSPTPVPVDQLKDRQLQDWAASGQLVEQAGRRLFFRQAGQGPALVLLHGFPTSSWDWHLLWPQLVRHYTLIAPDLYGFGFSDKPRQFRYSIGDQADWIEGLLALLGVKEAMLLAHDYGDTVAQELMARQLDRMQSDERGVYWQCVALLNGGLFPETHRPRPIQHLLNSPLGPLVSRLLNRKRFGKSFAAVFGESHQPTAAALDCFWELISLYGGHRIAHLLIRYINERSANRTRWVGALSNWQAPLCLINGPDDPVSGQHLVTRFAKLVPAAPCFVLPGVGHYPQVEDPEGVLAALHTFWTKP